MTTIRKVLAYGPAVVVSMMLTFVVGAVLPATVGLALFVGGLATMVALLLGAGEGPAVRILFRARDLSPAEAAAMAPAVALLCQRGVDMGAVRLRVQGGVVPIAAVGTGRRTVVVSAGLVAAIRDGNCPSTRRPRSSATVRASCSAAPCVSIRRWSSGHCRGRPSVDSPRACRGLFDGCRWCGGHGRLGSSWQCSAHSRRERRDSGSWPP